jgi:uncharacterized membrane protein HdeD (DUF308 family)
MPEKKAKTPLLIKILAILLFLFGLLAFLDPYFCEERALYFNSRKAYTIAFQ